MRSRNTEIISVGTELLLGHVTNTDARDVAEALSKIGVNVLWQTVVGDNPKRLAECIETAKKRADIIITTGGLGPTCDDITKQLLASSFGLALKRDEDEYRRLYDYINYKKRNLSDNVYSQAMVPDGCTVFHNNCGTAPGCAFEKDGKIVAMLPGPPKECRAMLNESLIPYLRSVSEDVIVSHSINIFGVSESGIDDIFRDEMNEMTNPSMAPYAKECDCLIQLTAKGRSEEECERMLQPYMAEVMEKIGDKVYGIDVDSLEQRVLQLLTQQKRTIAFIEKNTGGAISARLTSLPESDGVFRGAVIDSDVFPGEADIIVKAEIDGPKFHVKLVSGEDTVILDEATGEGRNRSFMRQMAGNYAFDTVRRYLCRT